MYWGGVREHVVVLLFVFRGVAKKVWCDGKGENDGGLDCMVVSGCSSELINDDDVISSSGISKN